VVSDSNDDSADDMVVSDDEDNTDHVAGNTNEQVRLALNLNRCLMLDVQNGNSACR
jgi:hypothetical protein